MKNWFRVTHLALAALSLTAVSAHSAISVAIDKNTQHQTLRSWGAVKPWFIPKEERITQQIIDVGVNDLGVTAMRYEPPAGLTADTRRWEWDNDDADPFHINWSAFNTREVDEEVEAWMVPIQEAIEANGDTLYIQVSPSFYDTGSSGEAFPWFLRSPGEYTEYAIAIMQRMRAYGLMPYTYTVCNEASYNNQFTETITKQMAKEIGLRMKQLSFDTGIQFPESVNPLTSYNWLSNSDGDTELWQYIRVASYHTYGSQTYRTDVCNFAAAKGVTSAQTEFLQSANAQTYLYDDMMANVNSWEVYGQAFPVADANGTSFTRSSHFWFFRQFMPYIRPGAVRVDALSSDSATTKSLAFEQNGKVTVLLLTTYSVGTQSITLSGLPAGEYGICQSLAENAPTERGISTVGTNGVLAISVPQQSVVTIYPHTASNMAPTLLTWQSSDSYLTLGVKSTTTLSVNAMDPELDTLTYQWSVVEAPAGASVVLAAPTAASCGASGLTAEGLYVFSVEVGDGQHSATREVLLRVFNGNQPPVFNNVGIRTPIRPILPIDYTTLDSGASDIEGSTVSYLWSVVSQPAGAAAVLANPTNQRCGVSGLSVAGDYVFRIEASDGSATSASNLTVTVYPEDVHAPAISNLAAALLGDGTGGALSADTSDADGDWISHWWEVTSKPVGSKVLFSNQGGPSTEVHADTSGSYSFKLTVVGPNQYTVSAVKTLSLPAADLPVTQFFASLTEGTLPLTVSFYNGSIGNITNCLWDFGDGATTNSTAEYVLHTYTEAGIKSVTMIAQGPAGSSTNTQPDLITVRLPGVPLADFTASPSSGWIPLAVTFTDTSGGTVTNRFWDFGDGSTTNTTEAIITHTYTAAGTNTVTLIAAGPAGTDTNIQPACVVATIPVAPTANFTATPHSGLTPLEVSFANISTGDITNSVWDFGDGTTLTSTSTGVNHTYTNAGSFTITLTVSGPAGSSTNTQAGLIDVELSTSTTVDITANTADRYITESTPLAYRPTGDTGCRVGDNSSGQRLTYVIPFQLPEIATGETITDVTLHLYAGAKTSFSSATDVYIDILGGRVDASATVTDADVTGTTAVLAANAQIINKNVTTPFTADHVLDAAFFQNIYNSDPSVAGKFVFITLRANKIDPISSNSYITYNAADASANKPVLSITSSAGSSGGGDTDGDGIPDEWETTWFGGATNANPNALASNGVNTLLEAYIAGLDPTDPLSRFTISNTWNVLGWNAISGRIYSVWGTTNLLESFQCLESNLLWPRNSWTDPVERSGAFYKIDVQLQN